MTSELRHKISSVRLDGCAMIYKLAGCDGAYEKLTTGDDTRACRENLITCGMNDQVASFKACDHNIGPNHPQACGKGAKP